MELMQWTATDNAFPILERLMIKHCIHLEKIPSSFVELYNLQLIELYGCHSLLVHSAKDIQQQQLELFGHNWLVVLDYNTQVETTFEEKEQAKRGEFEEQELEKDPYFISIRHDDYLARDIQEDEDAKFTNICQSSTYPDSSYFARQIQEEEDAKLTNVNFFNCFEDDFHDNDIN